MKRRLGGRGMMVVCYGIPDDILNPIHELLKRSYLNNTQDKKVLIEYARGREKKETRGKIDPASPFPKVAYRSHQFPAPPPHKLTSIHVPAGFPISPTSQRSPTVADPSSTVDR